MVRLDEFIKERRKFKWINNEKTEKEQFHFEDTVSHIKYEGKLKNIHRSLVNHARICYE
jgi:hypothetical protein